jgi:uncharacterized membrane protein
MLEMIVASLLFIGTHLGISSTSARDRLIASTGHQPYLGLYSLVAVITLAGMIWVYTQAPRFDYFWLPDPTLYWAPKILMVVAFILIVGSFMVPNPAMVGMEGSLAGDGKAADGQDVARGVLRITRHPFQWGVVLWALSHLIANGDQVSVVFFGAFGLLSLVGTFLMDRKKARNLVEGWQTYTDVTSNIPLGAVFTGRNRLVMKELYLPGALGIGLYILIFWTHEWVSGVPVFL